MGICTNKTELTVEATEFLESLEQRLPSVFDRATASKCLGFMLSPKTLSNADAQGNGPKVKMKLGKKIVYERAAFLEWLRSRLR